MEHRRLEDAAEGQGLRGVLLPAARELLDFVLQIPIELLAQLRQIDATRAKNGLAIGVVRERIEEVFQCQMRVTPGGGLAMRDGQDDFERGTEHDVQVNRGNGSRPYVRSIVA